MPDKSERSSALHPHKNRANPSKTWQESRLAQRLHLAAPARFLQSDQHACGIWWQTTEIYSFSASCMLGSARWRHAQVGLTYHCYYYGAARPKMIVDVGSSSGPTSTLPKRFRGKARDIDSRKTPGQKPPHLTQHCRLIVLHVLRWLQGTSSGGTYVIHSR